MDTLKDEHILIKNLIQGDAVSFDEIFDRFNKKVYAFSLSNLKNKQDAEEVVQEVFYNLWKDRAKLKDLRSLDAWIFAISFNIIRKQFRKLARERIILQNFSEIKSPNDNSTVTEVEYADLLEKAGKIINKLPPRQKSIYLLSKREGLSNTEISTKLNITKKTVENHLTTAKTFLRRALVDEHLLSMVFFWLFLK